MSTLTLTTYADVPWNGPYYATLGFHPIPDDQLGTGLRRIRQHEHDRGLHQWPRIAMRKDHDPGDR